MGPALFASVTRDYGKLRTGKLSEDTATRWFRAGICLAPTKVRSPLRATPCRSHDLCDTRDLLVISKLLQGNRKALAKIRMFIDRSRQVDLIRYAKEILKRYAHQPRRRTREKIRHCRKVGSLDAALPERLIQSVEGAMPLLARL